MNEFKIDNSLLDGIWDEQLGATPDELEQTKVNNKDKATIKNNSNRAYEGQSSKNEEDSKQDDV